MADLVDTVHEEIAERLKELAPMMVEFERLSAAEWALEGWDRVGSLTDSQQPWVTIADWRLS